MLYSMQYATEQPRTWRLDLVLNLKCKKLLLLLLLLFATLPPLSPSPLRLLVGHADKGYLWWSVVYVECLCVNPACADTLWGVWCLQNAGPLAWRRSPRALCPVCPCYRATRVCCVLALVVPPNRYIHTTHYNTKNAVVLLLLV